jgi:hypothetical protein
MTVPWPVLWLVDPAGAYLARRSPRPRGPVFYRAAVFGPEVPGGSRQATDEEIAAMEAASSERGQEEAEHDAVPSAAVRAAAQRLVRDGAADLVIDDRRVETRIVRFWRGDSLLEVETTARDGTRSSRIRIPRRPGMGLLADHLVMELSDG